MSTAGTMLVFFLKGVDAMPSNYSLPDVLERIYENQQALEAAFMELTSPFHLIGNYRPEAATQANQ
jgi:hypothetical protein